MFNNNNLLINTSDKDLYNMQFTYPKEDDPHLQSKLLRKKELYKYKCSHIPEFKNYIDLKLYRDEKCSSREINLTEQQLLLSNYFNVNSNQKGLLLFHGLGSGKTCTAITIAETFKQQCIQYNTKIIVLVPGPTIKESWYNELLKCTGNIYQPYSATPGNYTFNEFYKVMSYKSFYRKVLGERVKSDSSDSKNKYKKDENGEYVRIINSNKLESLDNTLLICDEAHNITGNNYYDAVKKIINNSKNLKVLLLTGTPMKNVATDIIDLINLLKPEDKQIKKSKIFYMDKNNDVLDFVDGGKEYLQDSIKGYVSYFKSTDPYIFALQNDIGIVSPHLKFTKIIPCQMSKFHKQLYDQINSSSSSHLEKTVNSSVNFALPKLENDTIIPARGKEGIKQILNELKVNKSHYNIVLQKFLQEHTKIKDIPNTNLITFNNEDQITGSFLHENFLHIFSIKFAQCLKNINELVVNLKGVKTAFIYSNLVLFGINLFKQVLLQNGYMEFKENTQKTLEYIPDHIRCYYCGHTYKEHTENKLNKKIEKHEYYPACFISITGGDNQSEELENDANEDAKKIIQNVFCDPNNAQGKYIKFVLGSKVLSEGFNLKNVGEVHILDSWFNFTRIEQTIGRGIRRCSHMAVACEDNPYPKVNVYKYCIVLNNKDPSSEELIYQNAERKHILIKEIEHLIKENTIDCALNHSCININKYKKCIPITTQNYDTIKLKEGEEFCPVECDYQKCNIKCSDKNLEKYYDIKTDSYNVPESDIDQNDININIVNELSKYKQKIKGLFLLKYVYTLDELMQEFLNDDFKYFDQFYFYKALDDFIPKDENEKNNFTDILIDKYNRPGYLIYVNKYYIFQPFGMSEKEIMKYKTTQTININNDIGLYEFMKFNNMIDIHTKNEENNIKYDFETYKYYYLNRKEYTYVGIIDKEPNKKKSKQESELKDIFKLRKKITMNTSKKRESGLQTYNGSVCFNSYTMDEIKKVFQNLKIPFNPKLSRIELCNQVRDKLYDLEKYSNDGLTYLIIPSNHPVIPFPLNLKDRVEFIKQKINKKFDNVIINVSSKVENKKKFYIITIKKNKEVNNQYEFLKELGFTENKDSYEMNIK